MRSWYGIVITCLTGNEDPTPGMGGVRADSPGRKAAAQLLELSC